MNRILLSATILVLIVASCKKGGDDFSVPANSWQHDTVTVAATTSSRYKASGYSALNFSSSNPSLQAEQLTFSFYNNFPLKSGTFKITAGPQADDEIAVIATRGFAASSESLSLGTTCNLVVDDSGKISLQASHIAMKELLFVGGDTSYYSFNLKEF